MQRSQEFPQQGLRKTERSVGHTTNRQRRTRGKEFHSPVFFRISRLHRPRFFDPRFTSTGNEAIPDASVASPVAVRSSPPESITILISYVPSVLPSGR